MIPKDCEECRSRMAHALDGALDAPTAVALREHVESCADCRAEYEWLVGFTNDLERLGNHLLSNVPEVDLVDAVMARLEETNTPRTNVTTFVPRRSRVAGWTRFVAAAAALVLVAGMVYQSMKWTGPSRVAVAPPERVTDGKDPAPAPTDRPGTLFQKLEKSRHAVAVKLEEVPGLTPRTTGQEIPMAATEAPELASLTPRQIADEKRKGLSDVEARAQLVRWASLSRETAEKVIATPDAAPGALVAAAQALDVEAAEPILLAAVGHHPESPYLHMATARKQLKDPNADPVPQLRGVRENDAENALPLYVEAELQLANGNLAEALALLNEAAALSQADAYSLQAAQDRALALEAAGMDPQAARLLTALTAGTDEYNYLCDLANNLIRYGQAYAEQGLSQEAQRIFEAVQQMGLQVQNGASLSTEQLAGLDIQQQAVDSLAGLYNQLGLESTDSVRTLVTQTEALLGSITELGAFFGQLDDLLAAEDATLNRIADVILTQGDLNIFEILFGVKR